MILKNEAMLRSKYQQCKRVAFLRGKLNELNYQTTFDMWAANRYYISIIGD